MNRVIRYKMAIKKLKQSKVKFRQADDDFITEVKHLFSSTMKETQDWRSLMKVILQGVDNSKVTVVKVSVKSATISKEAPVERESDATIGTQMVNPCGLTFWVPIVAYRFPFRYLLIGIPKSVFPNRYSRIGIPESVFPNRYLLIGIY